MKSEIYKSGVEVERSNVKIADVSCEQLANQQVVDAICLEMHEAAQAEKESKAEYTAKKDAAKRLFAERFGENASATMYSPENGIKIQQSVRGGGVEISQEKFLAKLYEVYDEEPGDMDGLAWQAFMKVSKPVECPRVIDPELFEEAFLKEQEFMAGIGEKATEIPMSVFMESKVETKPTIAVTVKAMTKAEKADADIAANFVTLN